MIALQDHTFGDKTLVFLNGVKMLSCPIPAHEDAKVKYYEFQVEDPDKKVHTIVVGMDVKHPDAGKDNDFGRNLRLQRLREVEPDVVDLVLNPVDVRHERRGAETAWYLREIKPSAK